jgi:hypothetical protein
MMDVPPAAPYNHFIVEFSLAFLLVLAAPLSAQEEIPLEDVFRKIEARLAPIGSMTARVRRLGYEGCFTGRIHFRPGKFLRGEVVRWSWLGRFYSLGEFCYRPSSHTLRKVGSGWRSRGGQTLNIHARREIPGGQMPSEESVMSLWEVALWPRKLLSFYSNLKAHREMGFLVISGDAPSCAELFWDGNGSAATSLRWYFSEPDCRLEKMTVHRQVDVLELVCREYVTIKGVPIPSRIDHVFPPKGMDGVGRVPVSFILDDVRSPAPSDVRDLPAWLDDPALPEGEGASSQEVEKRLKADPTNGKLVMELANLSPGMNYREVLARTKEALAANPESALLRLHHFAGSVIADRTVPAELLEEEIRRGDFLFDALAIAVFLHCTNRDFKKAKSLLLRIPDRGVGVEFRKRVGFHVDLCLANSPEEFGKRVDRELEGLSIADQVHELSGINLWATFKGKPAGFLERLAATGKPAALLLAARQSRSLRYYLLLADSAYAPVLVEEFRSICAGFLVSGTEKSLVMGMMIAEKIVDHVEDVDVLILAAGMALKKKRETRFFSLVKRLIQVCHTPGENVLPFGSSWIHPIRATWDGVGGLFPLLKGLVDAGRIGMARDLLLAYVTNPLGREVHRSFCLCDGLPKWNKCETALELLPRILGDDFNAKYRYMLFSGAAETLFSTLDVSRGEYLSAMKNRIQSGNFALEEIVELGYGLDMDWAYGPGGLDLKSLPALFLAGVKLYPEWPKIREWLGDVRYMTGEHQGAIDMYRTVLERRKLDTVNLDEVATPFGFWQTRDGNCAGIRLPTPVTRAWIMYTVIRKMVHAHVAMNRKDLAVKAVESYLEVFGPRADGAREAFQALGMEERIISWWKPVFLQRLRKTRMFSYRRDLYSLGQEMVRVFMRTGKGLEACQVLGILLDLELKFSSHPGAREKEKKERAREWEKLEKQRATIWKRLPKGDLIGIFLKGKFSPLSDDQKSKVNDLIEQMRDDRIDRREEAFDKLRKMGPGISPYLSERREGQDTEVAGRIRDILVGHAEKALLERFLEK